MTMITDTDRADPWDHDEDGWYDEEDAWTCEICNRPTDDFLECAVCHGPGCPRCLLEWDDVFPYVCPGCADLMCRAREEDDET